MKKVRYAVSALGAVGVVPALGMLAQGPAAAATHNPAKTIKTVSVHHIKTDGVGCKGHTGHMKSSHSPLGALGMVLNFWSTAHGGRTCIGTIKALAAPAGEQAKVWVARPGHNYCEKTESGAVSEPCHTSFTRPFTIFATSKFGGKVSWRV